MSAPSLRRKVVVALAAMLVLAALVWRFPLVRVVSLEAARKAQPVAFDAGAFAQIFWATKLLPATNSAPEVRDVLAALAKDPAAARKQFGHSLGMSSTTAFFVRGSGRVTAIDADVVRVAVDGTGIDVSLVTDLIFGNAVRDGTGLLDVSAYSDSQEFNEISTQLNGIVEKKVAPALREGVAVGKPIRFAGCFELEDEAALDNLQIVPVMGEWP